MNGKVSIEIDAKHEAIVRRVLAMREEMEQLALTAADGTVFHACEEAVIEKGRRLQSEMLGNAVAQRIEAAEKKGVPCVAVPVSAKKKTRAPKSGI
jgi:hypothetical protein